MQYDQLHPGDIYNSYHGIQCHPVNFYHHADIIGGS